MDTNTAPAAATSTHPAPPAPPSNDASLNGLPSQTALTRGWLTTEFWSHAAIIAGLVVASFMGALPAQYAALAAALSSGFYAVSRGLAKSAVTL